VQQLPQNVIAVLEVARQLLGALDSTSFPSESQAKFFSLIDGTYGALIEQFSLLIRGLKLSVQESSRVMASLIAAVDLATSLTARWPTQKGTLVTRTFVAETMHPHGCSVMSEWTFDFGHCPSKEILISFVPETAFPDCRLRINTDKDEFRVLKSSAPAQLKLAGSVVTLRFHAGRYTDGETNYGFKATVAAQVEERRWMPMLASALSDAIVSLFADSNAKASQLATAPDPVLSTKLFENGLLGQTTKLSEGERLILEIAEASPSSTGSRASAFLKLLPAPDDMPETAKHLAACVLSALLWHKNLGATVTASAETKVMNVAVLQLWSEATDLARKVFRSEQSETDAAELEQKCKLLLRLAPCAAPVRRMLTASMVDMKRKFYVAPSRPKNKATEALEAVNAWR
jgi:hypothetical protein